MKKAIVTGASGFLGRAVVSELLRQGIKVIALCRNREKNELSVEGAKNLKFVRCEMSEYKNLAEIISDRDIDTVYHFAWEGSAGQLRGDYRIQTDNISYSCDLVRACADIGCKRIVFASSIVEYEVISIMEKGILPGIGTIYSTAKLAADYLMAAISCDLKIEYIRAVISNVYGPGENSPRMINTSLRKMLKGEHCSFSPGEQLYDFIYVTDAARAFVGVGERGINGKKYYIGSRKPRALKEFLYDMRDCVDKNIELGIGELSYNGVSLSYKEFDMEAVYKDTGIVPKVDFKEGIINTIEWMRKCDGF